MLFELTEEEQERVGVWYESLKPKILEAQRAAGVVDPLGEPEPYYGASGSGLTYEITPTGIGTVIVVREYSTGETLDLTNYGDW